MAIAYNAKTVTDGLVLYLDAANRKSYPGTGTTWFDLSGKGSTGTLINSPTFSTTNGGSFVFNGVNTSISCGDTTPLNITTGDFTLSAWFNMSSSVATWTSIMQKGTSGAVGYGMHLYNNTLNASIQAPGGTNQHVTLGSSITLNVWHNASLVFNRTSDVIGYLNGVNVGSGSITGNAGSLNNTNNFIIGAYPTSWWFPGNISSVSVYNRALSADEIQQNFNALRGRYNV